MRLDRRYRLLGIGLLAASCRPADVRSVVVYTSVDQVYSEPLLRQFERASGIHVRAVYDIEANKTTGLASRLLAEKGRPRADVFWSGEFAQTLHLKERGAITPFASVPPGLAPEFVDSDRYWVGAGGRARVLIVNTRLVRRADYPASLADLLDSKWPAQRIGMASPLFGTSATHAAALYALLGPERAASFYRHIKERGVRIVDGNSVVRDMVARGQLLWGVTDTDDAAVALKRGDPVDTVIPDEASTGAVVIPGTVALVAGAPHPGEAAELARFLVSPSTESALIAAGFCHVSLFSRSWAGAASGSPLKMAVAPAQVRAHLARAHADLLEIFGR